MLEQTKTYSAKAVVRTMIVDDGCIMLNVDSGRFYSSTGLGAQLWSQLVQKNRPATVIQLTSEITDGGSQLPDSALQDIKAFLENLESAGFITSAANNKELVEQQATQTADISVNPARAGLATKIAAFCIGALLRASRLTQLFAAYWAIATADLIIKVGGFRALHRAVRNWPVSSYKAAGQLTPEEILSAVDKASAFYRRKARCLQRSCSAVWLLRAVGIPARLIIGCRKLPFLAHAWVEIDNQVVGDSPLIKNLCTPMECI
jgi:hypothetical protein